MEEDKDAKIKKQIEFYFSDSNFPRDKFLRSLADLDTAGYVPIDKIVTFKRLQQLEATQEDIARILKGSATVEVSEDGKKLRRVDPLPDSDTTIPRTLYAKGFPRGDESITIDAVSSFFSKYGNVVSVRLLRFPKDKVLKGAAFVEFSKEEELKQILQEKILYGETELKFETKRDYLDRKKKERLEHSAKRGKKHDRDEEEEANGDKGKQKEEKEPAAKRAKKEEEQSYEKGAIMYIKNIGSGPTRESLRELIGKYGTIQYIDFQKEAPDAWLRFSSASDATKALESFKTESPQVGGQDVEVKILEGEEEDAYHKKIEEGKSKKKARGKSQRGRGRGRGRGRK